MDRCGETPMDSCRPLAHGAKWAAPAPTPRRACGWGCSRGIACQMGALWWEDSFRERLLFGFLFRDGWKDHHAFSILPFTWGDLLLFCCQLERDNSSENLINVSASGSWVEDAQLQFIIRTKNKHHMSGHKHALFVILCWVQHVQLDGKVPILMIRKR